MFVRAKRLLNPANLLKGTAVYSVHRDFLSEAPAAVRRALRKYRLWFLILKEALARQEGPEEVSGYNPDRMSRMKEAAN
jgi:hypothetical protein